MSSCPQFMEDVEKLCTNDKKELIAYDRDYNSSSSGRLRYEGMLSLCESMQRMKESEMDSCFIISMFVYSRVQSTGIHP